MNIFNYDSKFMQVMLVLADLIIMNVLYVVCSLPIFTMGAAQAGLFAGISVLMNKEDDSSCAKAFFKGFRSGFGKITILHCIICALIAVAIATLTMLLIYQNSTMSIPSWMCVIAIGLLLVYHAMLPPFHATFDCKLGLLAKDVLLMVLAHPIQCLVIAALMAAPVLVFLLVPGAAYYILGGILVFITIYYSIAYLIAYSLLKKPFQEVKDNFKAANAPADNELEAATEIAAEAQTEDCSETEETPV